MIQFNSVIPVLFKGYALLAPELLLIIAAGWALFADRLPGRDRAAAAIAAVLVLISGLIMGCTAKNTTLFAQKLIFTSDSRLGSVALCALVFIWLVWTAAAGRGRTAEAVALVCLSLTGALLAIQAADVIVMLVAIELSAMPIYILIGYRRKRIAGLEGALKYFLLAMLTSLFLFYGASFVFGLVGTTSYGALPNLPNEPLATVALIFLFVGILAKMSAAPFHFWAPDAYAGAEPWSVAFAATVPKIAAGFVLVRLMIFLSAAQTQTPLLKWTLLIAAVLSMVIGSLSALTQKDVRRMMAYSGIVNTGYVMLALGLVGTAASSSGLVAAWLFLVAYALPTMGILLIVSSEGGRVADLIGLSRRRPLAAACLAICALSLVGIPPLVGFFGKFFIFIAGVAGSLLPFVILMVIVSVTSAFYYLRMLKAAFFDKPEDAQSEEPDLSEERYFGWLLDADDDEASASGSGSGEDAEGEDGSRHVPVTGVEPARKVSWGAEAAIVFCALLTLAAGPASGLIMAWLSNPRY